MRIALRLPDRWRLAPGWRPPPATVHARLLPHEWLFGGWLAGMAVILLLTPAAAWGTRALFAGCAALAFGLIGWCARNPTPLRWRLRLLWHPCAMGVAFYALPAAVTALDRPRADTWLAAADTGLLGQPAALALAGIAHPLVTDVLTLAYLFFFVVLVFGPGYYCLRDLPRFRACIAGLFSLYALGFTGYVVLPAAGPGATLALPPLPLGPFSALMGPVIHGASNGVDVFPSIHFAASLYLLLFDWSHYRRRFWQWLLPILLLWLSTVYLRYHYVVDLAAGGVVALLALLIAHRFTRAAAWKDGGQPPFIAPTTANG